MGVSGDLCLAFCVLCLVPSIAHAAGGFTCGGRAIAPCHAMIIRVLGREGHGAVGLREPLWWGTGSGVDGGSRDLRRELHALRLLAPPGPPDGSHRRLAAAKLFALPESWGLGHERQALKCKGQSARRWRPQRRTGSATRTRSECWRWTGALTGAKCLYLGCMLFD